MNFSLPVVLSAGITSPGMQRLCKEETWQEMKPCLFFRRCPGLQSRRALKCQQQLFLDSLVMSNGQGTDGGQVCSPGSTIVTAHAVPGKSSAFPDQKAKAAFGNLFFSYTSTLLFEVTVPTRFLSGLSRPPNSFLTLFFFNPESCLLWESLPGIALYPFVCNE